jgi:hypothetical protein
MEDSDQYVSLFPRAHDFGNLRLKFWGRISWVTLEGQPPVGLTQKQVLHVMRKDKLLSDEHLAFGIQ